MTKRDLVFTYIVLFSAVIVHVAYAVEQHNNMGLFLWGTTLVLQIFIFANLLDKIGRSQ